MLTKNNSLWHRVNANNLVRHKSGTYYLSAKVGGKKIRKSLETSVLRIAKIKRDELLPKLRAKSVNDSGKLNTIEEGLLQLKVEAERDPSIKPRTKKYYAQCIQHLMDSLPVVDKPSSLTQNLCQMWWEEVSRTKCASQANNILSMLKRLCDLFLEKGQILFDPTKDLKRLSIKPKHYDLPSKLKFAELLESIRSQPKKTCVEAANQIEFLAYSGLRHGELLALRWEDVKEDFILVTGGKEGTKNNEFRHVPIIEPMYKLLGRIKPEDPTGEIFNLKSVKASLGNACKRIGIPHMRIHDLRHLFATTCIESGVDIPTVSKWLGHKDGGALAMRVYGHLRDEHSRQQAKKVQF